MKNSSFLKMFFLLLVFGMLQLYGSDVKPTSLKEIYQSGSLNLTEELTIGTDNLPKEYVFGTLHHFAITNQGYIFIVDIRMNNVKIFNSQGKFIKVIGKKGKGPGDFYAPSLLAYNGENIIVWEIMNRRFSFFTEDGTYVKSIPLKLPVFFSLNKFKTLKDGSFILGIHKDPMKPKVGQEIILKKYSKNMTFIKDLYQQHVFLDEYVKNNTLNIPQPFNPRVSWGTSSQDNIIIGFQKVYEIGIYDFNGKRQSIFTHDYQPLRITEDDKKEIFEHTIINFPGKTTLGANEFIKKNMTFPEFKPAFHAIYIDPEENILVFPNQTKTDNNTSYFDAFDKNGKFIGKVWFNHLKISSYSMIFINHHLWTIYTVDEDEPVLVKYKIKGKQSTAKKLN